MDFYNIIIIQMWTFKIISNVNFKYLHQDDELKSTIFVEMTFNATISQIIAR